jgi:GTP-binding protein HflX
MVEQEKVILIGADFGAYDAERSMDELWALAESDELTPVATALQKREKIDTATYLGKGKLEEIKQLIETEEVDYCIFDAELSGMQIRNIEKILECEIMDRTMLILDIFNKRAVTNEGKLQTELAKLQYRLPRLSGLGASLSRQGGGGGGGGGARRGAGESRLEYDRRHIRRRITYIQSKLKEAETRKSETRRKREKNGVPLIALVGYTNVGKSSLLNAITGAEVEAADKLFATLDPTARSAFLPSGQQVIFIDTVGFVSRLPHHLVEAFKNTLEEAKYADILLCVCDAADDEAQEQLKVTDEVLKSLEADGERVIVYNKADKLFIAPQNSKGVFVSAKTKQGLNELLKKIDEILADRVQTVNLVLPYNKIGLAAPLNESGAVKQESYEEDGLHITATVQKKDMAKYIPYILHSKEE